MALKPPSNMKPTLDKDLDKITRVEEATLHVTQQLAGLGAGFMFVVLAAVFAGAFVVGTSGAVIIIAAVAIGAYMAINIGANDVTNNVGPAVGAKAMPLAVALIIAGIKAAVVVLIFMHVKYSSRLTQLIAAAGFFWLGILLVLTMSDYLTRGWLPAPGM